MQEHTTKPFPLPSLDDLYASIHGRVVEVVEELLRFEMDHVLGLARYERGEERRGYRHGSERRRVTTELGPVEIRVPRGRIRQSDGSFTEAASQVLPRYARRTRKVDETILGTYLSGTNTRRIRKALGPILGGTHLSKSAVSRVTARLKDLFARWESRDLSEEAYPLLYLDAIHLKVRLVRRVVSVPVLAALGVREDGQKVLIALRLAVRESGSSWGDLVEDLGRRGLPAPVLVVSDGHRGFRVAEKLWPGADFQRCTHHKWENLKAHCPKHAHPELLRDYHTIVRATSGPAARRAYHRFVEKWRELCPAVVRSLEEAGERLLTFYRFPRAMWRSIRTTNMIENLNREFRRRTKTQASFSSEAGAVTLLYGLVAFGQIHLRKVDGYMHLTELVRRSEEQVA